MQRGPWTLETKRLGFRPLTQEDHEALRPILGDPDTMYAWEYGFSGEQITEWIDKAISGCGENGHAYHAAILKETGELVGVMGLLDEVIDGKVHLGLGYIVAQMHWGRGYAAEGARAWLNYAFEVIGAERVVAEIRPKNTASIRVAQGLGMTVTGEFIKNHNGKEMPHLIYGIEREKSYAGI